jgi:DNA polymerase
MNQKLIQLYQDCGINEIISEIPINSLQKKEVVKEVIQEVSVESKENFTVIKQSMVNHNVSNQFEAIGILAQRQKNLGQNNPMENKQNIMPINEIIAQTRKTADECQTLEELEKAVRDFDGCSLKKMATNTVFADGSADSKIMIIGEAPGNHEDLQGIPFCGDSGKLLNSMFETINLKREDIYITNTLFWRPPGNRRPTNDELAMCKPFVEKHIALMKPKLIVLMGATAMKDMLDVADPISKARGRFFDYQNQYLEDPIKTIVFFHPSYLMRQSSKKRDAWKDLLMIENFIA